MATFDVPTPHGPGRVELGDAALRGAVRGALVLGHGAGGGIGSPDLVAAAEAARAEGFGVALVEQPYRVAGRRSPAPAPQLDAAWIAIVERLRESELAGLPLVVGGRSSGARVACRTAEAAGAAGVVCLAFPLVPPGRASASSRLQELDGVTVPTLVVQGERDPFGLPPASATRDVILVPGTHTLRSTAAIRAAVGEWLARLP